MTLKSGQNLVILLLGLLTAFGPLSIDMYLPAFPKLASDLGVEISLVQFSLGAYIIGMSLGQVFYGPLSDKHGRKRSLVIGLVIYILASLGCLWVESITGLIVLRFIQGLGGCAGTVMSRAVVRDLFDGEQAAKVFSLLMLIMGLAPILAPSLGGLLLKVSSWRMIFAVLSTVGIIAFILVVKLLPETVSEENRNPLALKEAFGNYKNIVKDKEFVGFLFAGGMIQAGLFAYITGSAFVFMKIFGLNESQYGIVFGMNAFGLIFFSQVNRYLLNHYTIKEILRVVIAVNAICAVALFLCGVFEIGGLVGVMIPLFMCMSTLGMIFPNATAGALVNHAKSAGSASALLGTLMMAFGAISALCVSAFANGTIIPMVSIIMVCSLISFSVFFLFVKTPVSRAELIN
ncbi:drug resistance transporter, Bcr/CflA family [Bacteriovorax sp. BSW11_IV]|uniref:Bcr/CflA family multidrug efflux MFS transporter n=1 Tax=Bacteriovorax sp. BSW11_IV TaxID=1353529 RepID=UPI000389F1D6|nr:Bcr/CflA family multidrug efflux MFS transporter [Bacteriovorax sp. BSW11_IV]EQC49027.1 drug resistance transporter, Bcr/CflA family [Bacteriovorax sp. BSW11_IV]